MDFVSSWHAEQNCLTWKIAIKTVGFNNPSCGLCAGDNATMVRVLAAGASAFRVSGLVRSRQHPLGPHTAETIRWRPARRVCRLIRPKTGGPVPRRVSTFDGISQPTRLRRRPRHTDPTQKQSVSTPVSNFTLLYSTVMWYVCLNPVRRRHGITDRKNILLVWPCYEKKKNRSCSDRKFRYRTIHATTRVRRSRVSEKRPRGKNDYRGGGENHRGIIGPTRDKRSTGVAETISNLGMIFPSFILVLHTFSTIFFLELTRKLRFRCRAKW